MQILQPPRFKRLLTLITLVSVYLFVEFAGHWVSAIPHWTQWKQFFLYFLSLGLAWTGLSLIFSGLRLRAFAGFPKPCRLALILFITTYILILEDRNTGFHPTIAIIIAVLRLFMGLHGIVQTSIILTLPPLLFILKRKKPIPYGIVEWCTGYISAQFGAVDVLDKQDPTAWIKIVAGIYWMSRACQNIYEGLK